MHYLYYKNYKNYKQYKIKKYKHFLLSCYNIQMQILIKKIIVSGIILLLLDGIYINFYMREFADQIALVQRVVMQVNPIGAF